MLRPFIASTAGAAVLLLALTACSGSSDAAKSTATASSPSTSTATAAASSCSGTGDVGDISVTGDFGATPKVTIPKNLTVSKTSTKTLISGTGAKTATNDTLKVGLTYYEGATCTSISTYHPEYLGSSITPTLELSGASVGDRVLTVVTAKTIFGTSATTYGFTNSTPIVMVMDVEGTALTSAKGKAVKQDTSLPTVTMKAGKPVLKQTGGKAPTKTQIETIVKGTGTKVAAGDEVVVNYQLTKWGKGQKVLEQSYGSSALTTTTTSVVTGFKKALVGQKVGSRVIAVVPPKDGYGGDSTSKLKKDTLVFVIDILGTVASASS